MKYIDLHCDTLMQAYLREQKQVMELPGAMVDVGRLKEGQAAAQFFAIFMPPPGAEKLVGHLLPDDEEYIHSLASILHKTIQENPEDIRFAGSLSEYKENEKDGKLSAFLTIEDGRSIAGKLDNIDEYYDLGVLLISLTWNMPNCLGSPNSSNPEIMRRGLTDFGKEAVAYMEEKGVLVDVSHLSDGGFYDVADICKKPYIASHSNCRALSPHQRNLTDDMIRRLAQKGGVAGINFGAEFLNEDIRLKESRIERIVSHILHMMKCGGEDCLAIGTDFDGITGEFEIGSPKKMQSLFEGLRRVKITERQIEKLAYKNAERVIGEVMG